MAEVSTDIQQLRRELVGRTLPPRTAEVERGHVARFAEAIGDANPLWTDEAAARRTRYGGLIAPPTFLRSLRLERLDVALGLPPARVLDAGSEWEYHEPVRVGDRITAATEVVDVFQRQGSIGLMTFIVARITYTNQFGQAVATQTSTLIRY